MQRETELFYFSVEGECEERYFNWLQRIINSNESRTKNAKFYVKIKKDPHSFAMGLNKPAPVVAYHVIDIESNEQVHVTKLKKTLDDLAYVKKKMRSKVKEYHLSYTNFTFELWIILHKKCLQSPKNHRRNYLEEINRYFGKNYSDLDEFKREDEFNNILKTLSITDVKQAIINAEKIMATNNERGYVLQQYKTYEYYKENPSLKIHEIIKEILEKVGL